MDGTLLASSTRYDRWGLEEIQMGLEEIQMGLTLQHRGSYLCRRLMYRILHQDPYGLTADSRPHVK